MAALDELKSGKIQKMTDEELVNHTVNFREYVETATRLKLDRMQAAWNAYLGIVDFSEKAPWQSKNKLPKFSQAVRISKNTMKQSIIKAMIFLHLKVSQTNLGKLRKI